MRAPSELFEPHPTLISFFGDTTEFFPPEELRDKVMIEVLITLGLQKTLSPPHYIQLARELEKSQNVERSKEFMKYIHSNLLKGKKIEGIDPKQQAAFVEELKNIRWAPFDQTLWEKLPIYSETLLVCPKDLYPNDKKFLVGCHRPIALEKFPQRLIEGRTPNILEVVENLRILSRQKLADYSLMTEFCCNIYSFLGRYKTAKDHVGSWDSIWMPIQKRFVSPNKIVTNKLGVIASLIEPDFYGVPDYLPVSFYALHPIYYSQENFVDILQLSRIPVKTFLTLLANLCDRKLTQDDLKKCSFIVNELVSYIQEGERPPDLNRVFLPNKGTPFIFSPTYFFKNLSWFALRICTTDLGSVLTSSYTVVFRMRMPKLLVSKTYKTLSERVCIAGRS